MTTISSIILIIPLFPIVSKTEYAGWGKILPKKVFEDFFNIVK